MLFAAVAGGVGYGSAWTMIEHGSRASMRSEGPWMHWTMLGRTDADPYARAHVARKGLLPIASNFETSYRADVDSSGARLSSSCEYSLVIEGAQGGFWSIAAYSNKGLLVPNAADRYAFNSWTATKELDGRALITLARDARPGNWLPIGGGSQINLVLTVANTAEQGTPAQLKRLPEIERHGCR